MNAGSVAFIACRLLALYVIVNYGLGTVCALIADLAATAWRGAAAQTVVLAIALGAALILWTRAANLANGLTRPLPPTVDSANWTAADWQTMAVVCVGGLFALTGLHYLWLLLQIRISHSDEPESALFALLHVLFYIAIGVILVSAARPFVSALRQLRQWGVEPIYKDEQ
jgi:hypothetical protein